MWYCFLPLLVLAGLATLKLLLFRVERPVLLSGFILSLVMTPFCIESYFDNTKFSAPVYVTAFPFCLVAMLVGFNECYKVFKEQDKGVIIFRGYS